MPFRNVIHDGTFDPETLEIMSAAYDGVCKYLNLADRDDPLTALVAKKIIELASRGVRDADLMYQETLRAFGESADSP